MAKRNRQTHRAARARAARAAVAGNHQGEEEEAGNDIGDDRMASFNDVVPSADGPGIFEMCGECTRSRSADFPLGHNYLLENSPKLLDRAVAARILEETSTLAAKSRHPFPARVNYPIACQAVFYLSYCIII